LKNLFKILFFTTLIVVSYLAFSPYIQDYPKIFLISDKLNHFLAFITLTTLLLLAYPIKRYVAGLMMLSYGATVELIQAFLPYRSAEALDLIVDILAILSALALYSFLKTFRGSVEEAFLDG